MAAANAATSAKPTTTCKSEPHQKSLTASAASMAATITTDAENRSRVQ